MRAWRRLAMMILSVALIGLGVSWPAPIAAQDAAVKAILFYSPACPHCHKVISEDLPPLAEQYGDRLQIVGIDVSQQIGQNWYQAAITYYNIPESRLGVPALIVGDVVLVGSEEIPQQFPGLVEQFMAQGGVGWPGIPGLAAELEAAQTQDPTESAGPPAATDDPEASAAPTSDPSITPDAAENADSLGARLARDPWGNTLAIIVLLGMVGVLIYLGAIFQRHTDAPLSNAQSRAIPLLALVGLGVALYLAYVETTQVTAVCGPVGDCNTVQQSEYAYLFGVIPVGWMGAFGYVAIIVAWAASRFAGGQLARLGALALLAMTAIGVLFSIYLTFLEPFVIGATCAWCISSAVIMTALLWLSITPGKRALNGAARPA